MPEVSLALAEQRNRNLYLELVTTKEKSLEKRWIAETAVLLATAVYEMCSLISTNMPPPELI